MTTKSRSELRAAIFNSVNSAPKFEIVKFFGEDVEVRQPSMDTVLDLRNAEGENKKRMMVDMIIAYCFVPGQDEKLFEEGDYDNLVAMPFGSDFTKLQKAISNLTNLDLASDVHAGNSGTTVTPTTSSISE